MPTKQQSVKYLIVLFAVLDFLRIYRGLRFIYYITQALLLVFIIIAVNDFFYKRIEINKKTLLILLFFLLYPFYSLLTWFWSIYPLPSLLRGVNTIFVTLGISSIVILWGTHVKKNYFLVLLPASLVLISTNLVSLIFGIPKDAWSIGHGLGFAGFFNHQNSLASTILFTMPGLFYFLDERLSDRKNKRLFYLLIILNILILILSYSRTALLALTFGFIIFLIIAKSFKTLAVIASIAGIVLLLMLLIPKVNEAFFFIIEKQSGSVWGNRIILWEPSMEAAKEGGFFGLGLGVGDTNTHYMLAAPEVNDERKFYREKGNLFLAFIEETGILGLILFLAPVTLILKRIKEKLHKYPNQILFCIIISYLLHGQFESWNGAGSTAMQFFLLYNFMGLFTAGSN